MLALCPPYECALTSQETPRTNVRQKGCTTSSILCTKMNNEHTHCSAMLSEMTMKLYRVRSEIAVHPRSFKATKKSLQTNVIMAPLPLLHTELKRYRSSELPVYTQSSIL